MLIHFEVDPLLQEYDVASSGPHKSVVLPGHIVPIATMLNDGFRNFVIVLLNILVQLVLLVTVTV